MTIKKKPKQNDYIHISLVALEPEPPMKKGVILEALVKRSGDTVAVVRITLDGFVLYRNGRRIEKFDTLRGMFMYVDTRGW